MEALQALHRLRSKMKLTIGILSYHRIAVLHDGQWLAGKTMDESSSGNRSITTLRKLPIMDPKKKTNNDIIPYCMRPPAFVQKTPGQGHWKPRFIPGTVSLYLKDRSCAPSAIPLLHNCSGKTSGRYFFFGKQKDMVYFQKCL